MVLFAEFCNITQQDEWPRFFYGMPVEIRKSVIESAAKNMQIDDISLFLDKRIKKGFK